MANVNIPTTSVDQNEQDIGKLVKQLLNAYIILTEELTYLLNNLDTRNLNEVDGDILVTGTITGDKVAANTITAGNMIVDRLSAISANLGHITAGLIEAIEIFGSYIATSRGYPRCEFNSATNELSAKYSSSEYASLLPSFGGSPMLYMESNGDRSTLSNDSGFTVLNSTRDITIRSQVGSLSLECGIGESVRVDDFYYFVDGFTGESLQQKLDDLSSRISALGG